MSTGVLPHQDIEALCDFPHARALESIGRVGPIRPCSRANIRTASYDLRLGLEYSQERPDADDPAKAPTVSRLEPGTKEVITVPANGVVVVTMYESVCLDADMVGHLSLKVDLLLQGLIMANQSQVDAGYEGQIYALLYNLSGAPVSLKYLQSVLRLELVRLEAPTRHPYHGKYEHGTLAGALTRPLTSALEVLAAKVRKAEESVERLQFRATLTGIATVVALLVAAWATLLEPLLNTKDDVAELQRDIGSFEERTGEVESLAGRLAAAQRQIDTLSDDVRRLERRAARRSQ